jgi:hypothetical protein
MSEAQVMVAVFGVVLALGAGWIGWAVHWSNKLGSNKTSEVAQ